ncbi:DUF5753 domain-containing protein [Nocardiopsis deserti]|uniref:DUF5753 domain-containing protein n=1 Tax=Nocardiopsis deserti TaxID=2605988 RepID=UPI00123B27C6|nr:DUF5753 domain-containing protein [Nocardiopsis deserti]
MLSRLFRAAFQLAHTARRKGWWRSCKVIPDWFEPYAGLETEASGVRDYRGETVHALLQTEEYAFALAEATVGVSPEEAREHAALRVARQERLTGEQPPELDVVMNEASLHREVGGPEVMAAQLRRLRERCDLPHVPCRILPFEAGEHPAGFGSFTVLSFPASGNRMVTYGDVGYMEYGLGASHWEDPEEVAYYTRTLDGLRERALSPRKSATLVEEAPTKYK